MTVFELVLTHLSFKNRQNSRLLIRGLDNVNVVANDVVVVVVDVVDVVVGRSCLR